MSCHGDGGICKEIKQLCPLRAREDALEFFRARRDLGRTARASRNLETKFHALELRDALLLISSCNDPDSCKPPAQEDGYFYTLGEKKRKKDEYVHVGPSTSQDGRNKRTRA